MEEHAFVCIKVESTKEAAAACRTGSFHLFACHRTQMICMY
jgi:hypothetical protein